MSATPVVWLSIHDHVRARGTWDQGMLEALFDQSLWRVPSSPGFTHHLDVDEVNSGGGVVVVSGRYFNRGDVVRLNRRLAQLDWVILFVTSDEENTFPLDALDHPAVDVWVMTPDPARDWPPGVRFLGSGWPPHMRGELPQQPPERRRDVFFAGQVTHQRRRQCANSLATLDGVDLTRTKGFTQGLEAGDYYRRMREAKLAACPSGPVSVDSMRLFEALEAGCVPLADGRTPAGPAHDYWTLIFAGPPPFPVIDQWTQLGDILPDLLDGWPANAVACSAWWQAWKRRWAWDVADQITARRGEIRSRRPDDAVTVLVPTSPISAHPDTATIEATVASIRDRLPAAEILVMCDGVRPEQAHYTDRYQRYLQRLMWLCNTAWSNVCPVVFDGHRHQAAMTAHTLNLVHTPLLCFVEHDTPLVGDIDLESVCAEIFDGDFDLIRFHHESHVLDEHKHLMVDTVGAQVTNWRPGVARTVQWSQRPHVASTAWYRQILAAHFSGTSRTMIEDVMHSVVEDAWRADGEMGWWRYRLGLYNPGGNIQRSTHIDGRGADPKYSMTR